MQWLVKRHEPLFKNLAGRIRTPAFQIRSVILVLVNLKPARRRGLFFCLKYCRDAINRISTIFCGNALALALAFTFSM